MERSFGVSTAPLGCAQWWHLDDHRLVPRRSLVLAERLVLRRIVRSLPPPVGPAVTLVGQASRGGALWLSSALLLSLFGPRGRRAAVAGVTALVTTSAVANGPAKWLVRRSRPGGAALIGLHRLGQAPGTSSFPSSHTASAFAFAVAASAELPAAAPVLLPAALAVAVARMRAVRHYPSDVLAGAVLGAALAAATTHAVRHWRATRPLDR